MYCNVCDVIFNNEEVFCENCSTQLQPVTIKPKFNSEKNFNGSQPKLGLYLTRADLYVISIVGIILLLLILLFITGLNSFTFFAVVIVIFPTITIVVNLFLIKNEDKFINK